MGEVFIHNYTDISWEQDKSSKKNAAYGHMLIAGRDLVGLNPITMMIGLGWGLVKKTQKGDRVYELYRIWEEDIS